MKQKRFLSALAAFALVCGLVGCQADIPSEPGNTEKSTASTTSAETAAEEKYSREYDENGDLYLINNKTGDMIPPFPEGWSGERISKMVTIDGYQLTLPCKVSDILALSEDFRADEPFDYGDGTSSFQIWYKDFIAVGGIYINDNEMIKLINISANEYIKYEGKDSTSPEDVFTLFKAFSKSDTDSIFSRHIESDIIYSLVYTGTSSYSGIALHWENI